MILAIHQPQYLPWVPYCAKAAACDVFVYLDTVQFQKNGVQNRNQIKTVRGAQWVTVPVHATLGQTIREIRIADDPWRRKHIQTVRQSYSRASFCELFDRGLGPIIERPHEYLVDLNIAVTEWLFGQLGISCQIIRASDLNITGAKDNLVIRICKAVGATAYLSGQGARAYQEEHKFRAEGVELCYQRYQNRSYSQCYPELGFVSDLSALDLILNMGPAAREIMLADEAATMRQQ